MKQQDPQRQPEEFNRYTAYPESYRARSGSNNLWLGIIIGGLLITRNHFLFQLLLIPLIMALTLFQQIQQLEPHPHQRQ